jgi:23S rRNA (uridine2552-2'-O)-methyltransferase
LQKYLSADARSLSQEFWQSQCPNGFDVVLSDMCHFTHGNTVTDAYKSLDLARIAYEIASMHAGASYGKEKEVNSDSLTTATTAGTGVLKPGGSLVMKLLQGPGTQEFAQELREYFGKVAWHRPKATRSESKEVFLLGLRKK